MRRALLVVALGLALAGCTGDGDSADARAAIEGFDATPGTRAQLSLAIVTDPAGTREAALDLVEAEDPIVRIAAVYMLSVTVGPDDADALVPLLASSDPGERVLAAAGLLAIDDARAIPVLIEALGDETVMPFGFPPAHVWEKARYALLQSTGQDLGLREATSATEAAAAIPSWEAWWADAEGTFETVTAADPIEP